jgi:4-hydroxybenzoate polyprenyltransferase
LNRQAIAFLDLIRFPNVITAVADSWAGFLVGGGRWEDWPTLLGLAFASGSLYAGGVALNDVCDIAEDGRDRPHRPIPSGEVSRPQAMFIACGLLVLGLLAAVAMSRRVSAIAGLLVAGIVLYDVLLKPTVLGPATMGMCRSLNFLLGIYASGNEPQTIHWTMAGQSWLYVTSLTVFARQETLVRGNQALAWSTIGVVGAVLWVVGLGAPRLESFRGSEVAAVVLATALAYRGFGAAVRASPFQIQLAVKTFVLALPLFDACLVWHIRGPASASVVAALLIPAMLLARKLRVA